MDTRILKKLQHLLSGCFFAAGMAAAANSQTITTSTGIGIDSNSTQWEKIGTFTATSGTNGQTLTLHNYGGNGYNSILAQMANAEIQIRQAWSYPAACTSNCVSGYYYLWGGGNSSVLAVEVVETSSYVYDIYAQMHGAQGADEWVAYVPPESTFVWDQVVATPPTGSNVQSLPDYYGLQNNALVVIPGTNATPVTINATSNLGSVQLPAEVVTMTNSATGTSTANWKYAIEGIYNKTGSSIDNGWDAGGAWFQTNQSAGTSAAIENVGARISIGGGTVTTAIDFVADAG